jgi:hypothetical protein
MRGTEIIKLITVSGLTKRDSLSSEDILITVNWVCRSVAPGGGSIFEAWTNIKQRKTSEIPSGKSKTSDVVRGTLNVIVHGVHFALRGQRCPLWVVSKASGWKEGRKEGR